LTPQQTPNPDFLLRSTLFFLQREKKTRPKNYGQQQLSTAVAVIQQNNADVQARVTSRAAAEAAKASYMR
jgi:hypothetical protein